jgi:hypothetical protein
MRYLPAAVESFNEILTQGLSETEQDDLQTKLQRIIYNVSAVAPGTGDRFGLLPQNFQRNQSEYATTEAAESPKNADTDQQ